MMIVHLTYDDKCYETVVIVIAEISSSHGLSSTCPGMPKGRLHTPHLHRRVLGSSGSMGVVLLRLLGDQSNQMQRQRVGSR